MSRLRVVACFTLSLLLVACSEQEVSETTVEAAGKAKAKYDALAEGMVQSVAYVGTPLKDLTKEQMAAVAALLLMTRVAAQSHGIESISSVSLSEGFRRFFRRYQNQVNSSWAAASMKRLPTPPRWRSAKMKESARTNVRERRPASRQQ